MIAKILKGSEIKSKQGADAESHSTVRDSSVLPDSGGIVHKRVMDAGREAQRIVLQAEHEANRIREEARAVLADVEVKRQEAIRKGYAEGESKGLGQVTEKLVTLGKLREQFYDQAEPEVIKLIVEIAEKVIGKLVEENAGMIRSVVHQALERTIGDRITVKLNPEDYRSIIEGDHEFRDLLDRTRRLMFREDESISRGGCVVETEVGTIDARIETQLEAIRKALVS